MQSNQTDKTPPIRVGFGLTGSFCTFQQVLEQLELCAKENWDITPIMSEISYCTDTRFGKAESFIDKMQTICNKAVLHTIAQVEPIGPKQLLDVMIVAPCTGNTLGKLANGITDSSITMAVKAHLRNSRPVVLAVSTNDALSNSAKNIGTLFNNRNIFFVPMRQDNMVTKPTSLVAEFSLLGETVEAALEGKQYQPVYL